jgi:hypothetical protein
MVPRKPLILAVTVTFCLAFVFFARNGHTGSLKSVLPHAGIIPEEPTYHACTEHLGWLEPYQFTYPIQYVSRDIIASARADAERPSLTKMDVPLFAELTSIDIAESQTVNFEKCLPPL